jgi:HEPN domain-containing protein
MGNRAADWLHQAEGDLRHAVHAREDGDHDWSCFAAHQAAEKAVKALILCRGGEGWGHSVTRLLKDLARVEEIPDAVEIRTARHRGDIPLRLLRQWRADPAE